MGKKRKLKRPTEEVNASSMADIAFLLLIFFLVTTTIVNEKGVRFALPKKPDKEEIQEVDIPLRNMFNVLLNSGNRLLVEGKPLEMDQLKAEAKKFINNRGRNPEMSDSPEDAIVSFKADRGSNFKSYLMVTDDLLAAYNELRADYLKISIDEYLALDPTDAEDNAMLKQAKTEYPATLSEAEPTDFK